MLTIAATYATVFLLVLILLAIANVFRRVENIHGGLDLLADVIYLQSPREVLAKVYSPESLDILDQMYVKTSNVWPAPTSWAAPHPSSVKRSNAWPPPVIAAA